jgi:cytochrome P450
MPVELTRPVTESVQSITTANAVHRQRASGIVAPEDGGMTSSFGETFDPVGTHLQDPYPFYAQARKEAPVFWSPRMNAWVVTRYQDCYSVLRDNHSFSNANAIRTIDQPAFPALQEFLKLGYPPMPNVILSDGDLHRRFRRPYARHFSADRVAAAEGVMRQQVDASIDAFAGDGRAELMRQFIRPLPITVITHLYGLKEVDQATVAAGTRGLLVLQGNMSQLLSEEEQVAAMRDWVHLVQIVKGVVERRLAEPREGDLVTAVLRSLVPEAESLTLEEESMVVMDLAAIYLPGHETTAPQLANGIRHLLTHREQWELLCERPEMIPQAVEEICRYDTSVPGMFRKAKKATTVGGQNLAEGEEVFLALISANRDEAFVDRADVFDITRGPVKHLTFGFGAHYCIGAETGRRELRIALELLTRRLPGLRLADRPVEIEPVFVTRGPHELHVEW